MDVNQIIFLAPLFSVALFMLVENFIFSSLIKWNKVLPILVIQGLNSAVSLGLSAGLLIPFVMLVTPLQLFSFSEWQVPMWVSFTASILFLDVIQYALHYLSHKAPLLWRFHRLHHSDRKVDALTTLLHHPFEVASSFFMIVLAAVMFDVPTIALACYSAIFGVHAAFTHVNYELPEKIDRFLSWFFVTPNFHRLHHSLNLKEGNSNFSAIFTFPDYIFKTVYRVKIMSAKRVFGIDQKQSPRADSIGSYLINPFK